MIASPQPPVAPPAGAGRPVATRRRSRWPFFRHSTLPSAPAQGLSLSNGNPQPSTLPTLEPLEARIAPANIVAHWIGGSGNWSDPAHWDIGAVPTAGGGDTYSVVIDLPASAPVITVDQSISLAGLSNGRAVSNRPSLSTGVSTLSTSLVNTGAIDVLAGATLDLTGAFTAPTFGSLSAAGGLIKVSATINGGQKHFHHWNGRSLVVTRSSQQVHSGIHMQSVSASTRATRCAGLKLALAAA